MRRLLVRSLAAVGALTIIGVLLLGLALLFATRLLVTDDQPAKADAIVILSGGIGRAIYAANLYSQGYAPRVYVSRPQSGNSRQMFRKYGLDIPLEEEINRRMLLHDGVPESAIELFGKFVLSTVEEAESLRAALPEAPERILLVTTPYHTHRAKLIFESVFPQTEILALGTPGSATPEAWWRDRSASLMVVTELTKLAYWYAGGAFRSHGVQGSHGH